MDSSDGHIGTSQEQEKKASEQGKKTKQKDNVVSLEDFKSGKVQFFDISQTPEDLFSSGELNKPWNPFELLNDLIGPSKPHFQTKSFMQMELDLLHQLVSDLEEKTKEFKAVYRTLRNLPTDQLRRNTWKYLKQLSSELQSIRVGIEKRRKNIGKM